MADRTSGQPQRHNGLLRFSERGLFGPLVGSKDVPTATRGTWKVTLWRSVPWNVSIGAV